MYNIHCIGWNSLDENDNMRVLFKDLNNGGNEGDSH